MKKSEKMIQSLSGMKGWQNLKLGQKYGIAIFVTVGLFAISTVITFISLMMGSSKMDDVKEAGENQTRFIYKFSAGSEFHEL